MIFAAGIISGGQETKDDRNNWVIGKLKFPFPPPPLSRLSEKRLNSWFGEGIIYSQDQDQSCPIFYRGLARNCGLGTPPTYPHKTRSWMRTLLFKQADMFKQVYLEKGLLKGTTTIKIRTLYLLFLLFFSRLQVETPMSDSQYPGSCARHASILSWRSIEALSNNTTIASERGWRSRDWSLSRMAMQARDWGSNSECYSRCIIGCLHWIFRIIVFFFYSFFPFCLDFA